MNLFVFEFYFAFEFAFATVFVFVFVFVLPESGESYCRGLQCGGTDGSSAPGRAAATLEAAPVSFGHPPRLGLKVGGAEIISSMICKVG